MMKGASWMQRPLAILATLAAIWLLSVTAFDLFAASILFAHYLAAFRFHPWGKISKAGNLGPHLILIGLLMIIAQLMFQFSMPGIVLFFGIHFVLTELYENHRGEIFKIGICRAIYYGGVYLFFMKYNLGMEAFEAPLLSVTLTALLLLAFYLREVPQILCELSFLLPLFFAHHQPMRFSYILSYHVILWWMIPVVRGHVVLPKKILMETTIYTIFFIVLVFGTYAWHESNFWVWRREVTRFGYIHVAVSFMMSTLNPMIVRSGFLRLQGMLRHVV
jgi:hypothetical protein